MMTRIVILSLLYTPVLFTQTTQKPLRLMSEAKHNKLLKMFPVTTDETVNQLKHRLTFYTDAEMPLATQDFNGALQGIFSPLYNISAAKPQEKVGNPYEFPWKFTAGMEWSRNGGNIKFTVLEKPIVYWRENGWFRWRYATGTVFGEILYVTDPQGYTYPFELRTRTRTDKGWNMQVYRSFPTKDDLKERVEQLYPNWQENSELAGLLNFSKHEYKTYRVKNKHPRLVIDRHAVDHYLPKVNYEIVRILLRTPMKPALGKEWDSNCAAPTTKEAFHIVPQNYAGSFVHVSNKSCMTCHDGTGKPAEFFESKLQTGRDWYQSTRGGDNIFSFHIFEPSCISYNGFSLVPQIRQTLIQAGLLRAYSQ